MKLQLVFPDRSLGYIDAPEGSAHQQGVQVDGQGPIDIQPLHIDDAAFNQLIAEASKKMAVIGKNNKFVVIDKPSHPPQSVV